jgi:hypothetical protein
VTIRIAAIAAGVLALAGFATGRASKRTPPAEVRTVEKTRTEWKDREVEKVRTVTVAGKDRIIRRVVTVVEKPDGTKTTTATTDDATTERQTSSALTEATREASATQVTERVVHVVQRSPWAVSLLTGVNAGVVAGHAPVTFVGVEASRTVLGPLRLGVVVVKQTGLPVQVGVAVGASF